NARNSERYDDRVRQTISSSVRYSKRWPVGGRSLNLSLTQTQNLASGSANLTLPSLSFTQSARKPFQRSNAISDREGWLERITMSYSGSLNNRFDYVPLPLDTLISRGMEDVQWYDALFSPSDYRLATGRETPFQLSATHSVPISSNFSINRIPGIGQFRLNVNQSLNYTETWFTETERREFDEELGRAVSRRQPGFMSLRRYNLGLSANTTFYGMFPWRIGRFEGMRHTVRPSASFSFSPDFTSDFWGYTRTYQDAQGNQVRYPIASGVSRKQQTLSIRVDNVFETKVAQTDEEDERRTQNLKLLDLGINTAYNFAADSMQLSPINVAARTRILDQFDVRMDATYSPYERDAVTGRERSDLIFVERPWSPFRLTRANASISTSLRSQARGNSRPFEAGRVQPGDMLDGMPNAGAPLDTRFQRTGAGYADFAIPWSLDLDFNYGITRLATSSNRRATLNARFDFNLTPNWKVQGRSGYDLIQEEMVLTNLVVMRDFECWQLSINWTPFGPYQSWGFDLHVKSGQLRDLLRLRQPRRDVQGRFGGRL
ncbi:MAG: putative LPS assembly protein LptD, partial [Rhodothermales bacterium]